MKIDYNKILENANKLYALDKSRIEDISRLKPEQIPSITSSQVTSMMKALVMEINKQSKGSNLKSLPDSPFSTSFSVSS